MVEPKPREQGKKKGQNELNRDSNRRSPNAEPVTWTTKPNGDVFDGDLFFHFLNHDLHELWWVVVSCGEFLK